MSNLYSIKSVEEYVPYTKNDKGEPILRVGTGGLISLNEKVFDDWVKPNKRADLKYLTLENKETGESQKAIGIKPVQGNKGLAVRDTKNSKSKQISARGFLGKYRINPEGNNRLLCHFDQHHQMIVAPLENQNTIGESSESSSVENLNDHSMDGDTQKYRNLILKLAVTRNSGKPSTTIPEFTKEIAKIEGKRLAAMTAVNKRNYRQKIKYVVVDCLEKEGKLQVDVKRPYKGKFQTFYYKAG